MLSRGAEPKELAPNAGANRPEAESQEAWVGSGEPPGTHLTCG